MNTENIPNQPRRKYFISRQVDGFFRDIYSVYKFIARFFKETFSSPFEGKEIIRQCFEVGFVHYF